MEKKFSDLFAFDLDGTIVHDLPNGERGIPDYLLEVIFEISQRAHLVVATGRRYRAAQRDLSVLPEMPFSVLHNGLVVKDVQGLTIRCESISPEQAFLVAQLLEAQSVEYFFAADGFHENLDFIFVKSVLEKSEGLQQVYERTLGCNFVIDSLEEVKEFKAAPLLEVVSVAPHENLMRQSCNLRHSLPAPFRSVLIRNIGQPGYGALEIFPDYSSKWAGVDFVMQELQAERVVAVGDDENDIEMIRSAHIGLVMDHAEPHVKATSTRHIAGPKALAKFLKGFYK